MPVASDCRKFEAATPPSNSSHPQNIAGHQAAIAGRGTLSRLLQSLALAVGRVSLIVELDPRLALHATSAPTNVLFFAVNQC